MNPYNTYTDAQRIRDLIDWETSDGRDYVVEPGGIVVQESVTDAERHKFLCEWHDRRIAAEAGQR